MTTLLQYLKILIKKNQVCMRNEKLSAAEGCHCLWEGKKQEPKNGDLVFMENIKSVFTNHFQTITCQIVRLISFFGQMLKKHIGIKHVCVSWLMWANYQK